MTVEWAYVVYAYGLVCAVLAGIMARRKSRRVFLWVVLGFFLGIIGLIILARLGEGQDRRLGQESRLGGRNDEGLAKAT